MNDASLRPDLAILPIPGLEPFQAELCAPMQRAGEAFGAVAVYSSRPQDWTTEQFRLAEWLASQCAQILETLRMQQELKKKDDDPDKNIPYFQRSSYGKVIIGSDKQCRAVIDLDYVVYTALDLKG